VQVFLRCFLFLQKLQNPNIHQNGQNNAQMDGKSARQLSNQNLPNVQAANKQLIDTGGLHPQSNQNSNVAARQGMPQVHQQGGSDSQFGAAQNKGKLINPAGV